ncbi:hypothetical protein [Streptomyces chartreusis]|uniref:hypothetical protein n=1 Tax=Streptomyces chartreusis TaxID=1969 RepID=UPI002E81A01F|nr:hypothetical protein [Streptomyces chartreusis]WUB18833.1 hypothetical protein OG997_19845 [Streptomyces chartreusis]
MAETASNARDCRVRLITFRCMVSSQHDAVHRIFRQEPDLLARLVPETGVKFPEYSSIEPLDTDLTELRPLERRVDSFFRVRTADDEGGFLLAVESQTKPDPDKHNSWTYYLAHMYAKYRLPPILVVVCRDKKTAAWAEEPICIGRHFHTSMKVFPLVLGPNGVPPITDPEEAAKDLALTTFSVLVNAKEPGLLAILDAVAPVVGPNVDWAEFMEAGLDEGPARDHWRKLMAVYTPNFPGFGSVMEEAWIRVHSDGEAKGKAEGKAEDILRALEVRGVEVSESVRERVMACVDLEVLAAWFDRSLTVETTEELFAEG